MSLPEILAEPKEKELRVVAIGGGTGLSTLLRGLKRYVVTPDRRKGIRIGTDIGASGRTCRLPARRCGALSASFRRW